MNFSQFDRQIINFRPLSERTNKVAIERDCVDVTHDYFAEDPAVRDAVALAAVRLKEARESGASRMLAFGAHTIKNGLGPVLIALMEAGWVTHLATNGAGIIHDWEFAYLGESSEDVRANVAGGRFGLWEETGFYLNLAILVGAYEGLGYGASVGALAHHEGLSIPHTSALTAEIVELANTQPEQAAAAGDLLGAIRRFDLYPGFMSTPHRFKSFGVQAAAYRLNIPFTGHPMIGHDIIYTHPMNNCAAIGRAAQRDFLTFADGVSKLNNGVYLSVGSAVMSPMIFEKSLSMAQNVALQRGEPIENHFMMVADLAESHWDWRQGEPPMDNPDYYLRYNKTFARMGGTMHYVSADNREFLPALLTALRSIHA